MATPNVTVCPACAGMIRTHYDENQKKWGLPRMRGDDPGRAGARGAPVPFAPHARG